MFYNMCVTDTFSKKLISCKIKSVSLHVGVKDWA